MKVKWKIPSFFRVKNYVSQEMLVMSMIRVLSDGEKGYLRELLFMCSEYYGESVLSIICTEDRSIVATTASAECIAEVGNVAMRLKNTDMKYHYLRNEKNGLYFRHGYNCIRVIPLIKKGSKTYFLMVEQEESMNPDIDRAIDLLSMATELHICGEYIVAASRKDYLTGAKNRDALVDKLNEARLEGSENYLGMFFISNAAALNEAEGMTKVNGILRRTCEIMQKYFNEDVYRVSGSKICIWQKGELYGIVSKMQDCLEELALLHPEVAYGCVASPGTDEVYKAMYLCEKFSEKCVGGKDTVVVIREPEADFEDNQEVKYYYLEQNLQECDGTKDQTFYEEVPYEMPKDASGEAAAEQVDENEEEPLPDFFQFWSDEELKMMDVCEDL